MNDDIEVVATVGEVAKNAREVVRAEVLRIHGRLCLSLRVWAPFGPNGEMRPTKSGFAVRVEQAPELQRLVDDLAKACEEMADASDEGGKGHE